MNCDVTIMRSHVETGVCRQHYSVNNLLIVIVQHLIETILLEEVALLWCTNPEVLRQERYEQTQRVLRRFVMWCEKVDKAIYCGRFSRRKADLSGR